MAGTYNRITLIGHLGGDPEKKDFPTFSVVNFSLATNERWKNKAGELVNRTDWHNVTVFTERLMDISVKYLKKGNPVLISGRLTYDKYTDKKSGIDKTVAKIICKDVVLLGGNGGGESSVSSQAAAYQNRKGKSEGGSGAYEDVPSYADYNDNKDVKEDDIPF